MLGVLFLSWHLNDQELKVGEWFLLRLQGGRVHSEDKLVWVGQD